MLLFSAFVVSFVSACSLIHVTTGQEVGSSLTSSPQCTWQDCDNHAVAVSGTRRSGCVCTCRNMWGGAHCQICPPQFDATDDCGSCAPGYVNYPACTRRVCTAAEMDPNTLEAHQAHSVHRHCHAPEEDKVMATTKKDDGCWLTSFFHKVHNAVTAALSRHHPSDTVAKDERQDGAEESKPDIYFALVLAAGVASIFLGLLLLAVEIRRQSFSGTKVAPGGKQFYDSCEADDTDDDAPPTDLI